MRNILDFPEQFSPAAEMITLDRNYRSTLPILGAANAVIDLAEERFTKKLWTDRQSVQCPELISVRDEADQARYVVEKLEPVTPHGMQARFITSAYCNGVPDEEIMGHTRHRSLPTMRGYVRRGKLGKESPAGRLGL